MRTKDEEMRETRRNMKTRKQMKAEARKVLKRHYGLFVILCLMAGILGTEFTSSLMITKQETAIEYDEEGDAEQISGNTDLMDQFAEMLVEFALGDEEKVEQQAEENMTSAIERSKENQQAVFGRSRGVLSAVVNKVTSGKILVSSAVALKSIVGSDGMAIVLLIAISLILYIFVMNFAVAPYYVILRRMFLEGRTYSKVYAQRALFLLKVKKWFHTGWILLVRDVYLILWGLTIVGAIIKHYSYFMVPYIVAENPGIKANEAITLSRNLMKGHKWECFVLELSFLGWSILGALTFGLVDIFYTNPYQIAALCEFYAELRRLGKEKNLKYSEQLNDEYLFQKPDSETLHKAYEDVILENLEVEYNELFGELTGIRKFLAETFGLSVGKRKKIEAFEQNQSKKIRLIYDKAALEGKIYPARLYPIPEKNKRTWVDGLNYLRCYSVWSVIMMFFIMSFVGWIWEVSLHLISDGEFVNRGVLQGPWLPIYGSGSILILLLLNKFRRNPAVEFVAAIVLCGCVEYFTAYYLEMANNGKKWWDYSGYFLNLHGRICAEGLLVFGVGGMAIVYLLAPVLDNLIQQIPFKMLVISCTVLLCVFAADQVYSKKHPNEGKGITDYGARAEEMEQVACRDMQMRFPL